MTLRVIQALERGRAAALVGVIALGLGFLVWVAPASDQRPPTILEIHVAGASRTIERMELAAESGAVNPGDAAHAARGKGKARRAGLGVHDEHSRGIRTLGEPQPIPSNGHAWVAQLPSGPPAASGLRARQMGRPVNRHLYRAGTGPTPTPTATATPTPTPTPPPIGADLVVYKPETWANCVVCNYRDGGDPPVTESLVMGHDATYVSWAVANLGDSTVNVPITFGFYVDGALQYTATWTNPTGLPGGDAVAFNPMTVTVPGGGQHTVSVAVDPDGEIAEADETNNSCAFIGTWTAPPTPTPFPPVSGVDLGIYKPANWANGVVCNYREVGPPPVTESLVGGGSPTYVYWTVANFGTTTSMQPITFRFYLDGTSLGEATLDPATDLDPPGLPGSIYVPLNTTVTVPTGGQHTLAVWVDPSSQISDSNRSNNITSFNGTWTGPAPTPGPTAIPADPITSATWIFQSLLPQVATSYPSIDDLVSAALQPSGIAQLIGQFVGADPIHRVPVANGVSLVFGDSPVGTKFGVFTGSATVAFANLQTTSTTLSADYNFSRTDNFSINGYKNAVNQASGSINVSQTPVGSLSPAHTVLGALLGARASSAMITGNRAGAASVFASQRLMTTTLDATVSGTGTSPVAFESGSIHIDTSKCANYPISGGITITLGTDVYVFTFTDKCDGTFGSQKNPPPQPCNAGQQVAGSDTADTRSFDMGRTSGTFLFDWNTYYQEDRIVVRLRGQANALFDTGCVGSYGHETLTFNGTSSVVEVTVTPNCRTGTGTAWNYTLHCPQ